MTTLVQAAKASERNILAGKNAEIIVTELQKRFFEELPKLNSLIDKISGRGGLSFVFRDHWFDKQFPNVDIRNDAMSAAPEEFERWFKQMFDMEVRVRCDYFGDDESPYNGMFWWHINRVINQVTDLPEQRKKRLRVPWPRRR
jgi:hypothetical protein